jgi:ABC-type multidrug transport system fused ATPase/permease subunit
MLEYIKKINLIILPNSQKSIFILVFFLFMNSLFEVLSLTSLIPIVKIFFNSENLILSLKNLDLSIVNFFLNSVVFSNKALLILIFLFIFLVIFILKSFFFIFVVKFTLKKLLEIKTTLTKEMFDSVIMSNNYQKQISNSEYTANIQHEITIFAERGVHGLINLISEFLTALCLMIFIFLIQPIGSLVSILIFLTLTFLIDYISKKKISIYSKIREAHERKRISIIHDIVMLLNEIKIYKKKDFFTNRFLKNYLLHEKSYTKLKFIQSIARPSVEVIGLISVFFFFFISFLINTNNKELIIIEISIIVAASFRIIPSVYRISSHFADFRFCFPVIENLYQNLYLNRALDNKNNFFENNIKAPIRFDKIQFQEVSFKFLDSDNAILSNINLLIKRGDKIGIRGPSGSGKTTLINMVIGFLKPTSGKILLNGDLNFSEQKYLLNASYVSQNVHLINDTLIKNIAFGCEENEIDYDWLEKVVRLSNLESLYSNKNDNINIIGENSKNLSGGQKQRISIARAMYFNSDIIILDEASSALDSENEFKIINSSFFLNKEKTLIIISHKKSFFSNCDAVYEIKDKKLYLV